MNTDFCDKIPNIFCTSAKKYARKLPYLKKLMVTSHDEVIYISPALARDFTEKHESIKDLISEQYEIMLANKTISTSRVIPTMEAGGNYEEAGKIISVDLIYDFNRRSKIFAFDREIGNLLVTLPNQLKGHKAECAADAFAALMDIHRFGRNEEYLDSLAKRQQNLFLGRHMKHDTSSVFESVIRISEKIDVEKLPYKEVAKLAYKLTI